MYHFQRPLRMNYPVFIVMRIEEPQLLATMNRIERVVGVERDPPWDLPVG
jgi:hypothetical protein